MANKILYVLASTYVSHYGGAETTIHNVDSNYQKIYDVALAIGNSLIENGFRFRDEIYSGGQTNRYYIDDWGNEYNLQITKVWTR